MKDLIIAIAMIAPTVCMACAFGAITAIHSLEHYTYTKITDGKEELRIRLFLGPFSYTVVVPERRGEGIN